jgi:N-acetylglucosamine-6-phosphate deacetylase
VRLRVAAALADGRLVPGDVEVAGGVVRALGLGAASGGLIAVPGLVDLQVNGIGDVDLAEADADGLRRAGAALLAEGVTAVAPTYVSAPEDAVAAALRALPAGGFGPRLLGAHLEGPFLSPARAGAHNPAHLRAPDLDLLGRLLDAGPVGQMTLAPELPGALGLVTALAARGVTVSLGHSDATAGEAHAAFDAGARTVTHLFNAMRRPAARDPGVALAALSRADVDVQLIADGRHLADETLLVAWRAAPGRVALVSDRVGARLGGGTVEAGADGAPRRPDGTLAGSAQPLLDGVRRLHALGIDLAAALGAATAVPARIARRPDVGRLVPGGPADVVVLDDRLEVRRVLLGGADAGA